MGCCIECVRVSGVQEKQYKLPPSGKIQIYLFIVLPVPLSANKCRTFAWQTRVGGYERVIGTMVA